MPETWQWVTRLLNNRHIDYSRDNSLDSPWSREHRIPKPWAYELHTLCAHFNVLPRPGGILDQEFFELAMMQAAANIPVLYDMDLTELTEQDLRPLRDQAVEYAQKLQRTLFP
jgi:hypothetical protein